MVCKLLILGVFLIMTACTKKSPVQVGFSADLTGPTAFLGVMARDSALLAAARINREGGINGRELKLIIKDDKGDPETAGKVDRELIELGVSAIIGHITSSQTAAVMDLINEKEMLLFSYASSSNLFSRKKDYFFRSVQSTDLLAQGLAQHIQSSNPALALSIVYNERNIAFTGSFKLILEDELIRLGGKLGESYPYNPDELNLQELSSRISKDSPQALLILASSADTAFIIQYCKKLGLNIPYYASSWSHGETLLEKGGSAVNGLELVSVHKPVVTSPNYLEFKQEYLDYYQKEPGNIAATAYEAVNIMAYALGKTDGSSEGLREVLTGLKDFAGLESRLSIDEYGDVSRSVYILKVENGGYKLLNELSPK